MLKTTYIKSQVLVVGCVIASCLPCDTFAMERLWTPEQVRELARKSERMRLDAEGALIGVKQVRQDLINRVMVTQEMLLSLERKATAHFRQMSALLENEQGKLVAQDPNSLGYATYLRLKEEPAVTVNEIKEKQLLLYSLQREVLLGQNGPEVGYLPKQETRDQVNQLYFWLEKRQEAFGRQVSALNKLLRWEPTVELDTSQGTTLYEKLDERRASWEELLAKISLLSEDEVRPEIQEIMLEVYKYVALEKGKLEADILKNREELSLARKRQDNKLAMQDQTFQLERTRQLADEDLAKRQDNLDNQLREFKALRALDKALADWRLNKLETKTARQQLIAKVESKDVQFLLGPFFGDSYWQPNRAFRGLRPTPVSLELLKTKNALATTSKGLKNLYIIGNNPNNRDRKPWAFPRDYNKLSSEQRDQLWQAQQYLIELGPTLVELGYLAK